MQWILEVATRFRWKSSHFGAPMRFAPGRKAPVPDRRASGFPDIVAVRAPRLIFAECKSDSRYLRAEQREWQDVLQAIPQVETYVWRPRDRDAIEAALR